MWRPVKRRRPERFLTYAVIGPMEKITRLAFLTIAAIGVSSAALGQTVTAADVQKSLSGKRVILSCIDGTRGSGRYTVASNIGTIRGKYQNPDGSVASGVGRVRPDGDQLCLTVKVLNDGQEQCFGVQLIGKGKYAFTAVAGLVTACQVATR